MTELTREEIAELFADVLERAGASIVQQVSHTFPETGQTCVLILRESHAVLHTWPESGMVHVDIFTCSPRLASLTAIAELGRTLGAGAVSVQEISRADGHELQADPRQ